MTRCRNRARRVDHVQSVGVVRAQRHAKEVMQALGEVARLQRNVFAAQAQDVLPREQLEPRLQQVGVQAAREIGVRPGKSPLGREIALAAPPAMLAVAAVTACARLQAAIPRRAA